MMLRKLFSLDRLRECPHYRTLKMSEVLNKNSHTEHQYSTGELVRRLLSLAWRFRADCLWPVLLSLALLLLGLAGLQLLGVVIDVIRHALDPLQRAPELPSGRRQPQG